MISAPLFPTKSTSDILPSGLVNKTSTTTTRKNKTNKMMITKTLTAATLIMALFIGVSAAAAETSAKTTAAAAASHSSWAQNEPARLYITKYESTSQLNSQRFIGNHSDYFKILHQDEDTILVGGKNALYNLSISTLQEQPNTRIEWTATDAHRQLCMLKGKNETECQNYIRVYGKIGEQQFLLCGTNAYKPQCREYNTQRIGKSNRHQQQDTDPEESHEEEERDEETNGNEATSEDTLNAVDYDSEEEAQGRCPYNPQHSSSYVFADGQLYSGTVADFSSGDPLIYRKPQRTEQYDLSQLNQPDFISSFEHKEFVYFFFRENAMETMNCGPTIYSRVARVCKNDKGGPYQFNNRWTSFVKTRLNCSIPGDYPFYFNELKATSQIISTDQRNGVIYAVFQTPENSIPGSAVCAFDFDDIEAAFNGRFKGQKDGNSNWMPVDHTPEPHPSKCVEDSRTMSGNAVNFIRKHPLMETSASPALKRPSLTTVGSKHRLTAIAVDPQVPTSGGAGAVVDMIYVGTEDGRVMKFFNQETGDTHKTIIISDIQVLPPGTQITELTISKRTDALIVVSNGAIVTTALSPCANLKSCDDCVRVPSCVWDTEKAECSTWSHIDTKRIKSYLQEKKFCASRGVGGTGSSRKSSEPSAPVSRGTVAGVGHVPHTGFPSDNEITVTSINDRDLPILTNDPGQWGPADSYEANPLNTYTAQTMASSVVLTSIASLVVGLVVGLYLSRRRCHNNPFMGAEQRNHLNWHSKHPRTSSKDVNLLMNTNQLFPQGPPSQLMALNINHNNSSHHNNTMNNLQPHGSPKKDNLDHDNFDVDKDRTQEYKNSTESLDKEIMHNKMGTLQKVKKTYI